MLRDQVKRNNGKGEIVDRVKRKGEKGENGDFVGVTGNLKLT